MDQDIWRVSNQSSLKQLSNQIRKDYLRNYKNIHNLIINEAEIRSEFRDKNSDLKYLAYKLLKKINCKYLVITRGSNGAILFTKINKQIIDCPAFTEYAIDKIGSGDTMLSVLTLALNKKVPTDLAIFFGNIIGSMSVQIIANKNPIKFQDLFKTIESVLK